MTPKVTKSNTELIGPKKSMNRRMKPMSQCAGRRDLLGVDVVGGDGQLAGVVEQVVEQDLRGQHRQERQEQRGAGGAEHVPEVARRAHQDVLDRVGEDPAAFDDAVGEHVEVLLQQEHVGGVLGHVGGRVDRDADVGGVQRDGVVDAVAEERDVGAGCAAATRTIRALCSGADPGEDRGAWRSRRPSCVVVERVDVGAGERPGPAGRPRSAQTLAATAGLSPVRILTVMPRPASRCSAARASGFGRVEEDQEAARGAGRARRRR